MVSHFCHQVERGNGYRSRLVGDVAQKPQLREASETWFLQVHVYMFPPNQHPRVQ